MEGIYDIFRGHDKIGKAEVCRQGLYYRFVCCCDLRDGEICRVSVSCGGITENLGIPVPKGDCFYLHKRIPTSRFPEGQPSFQLTGQYPPQLGKWVPVAENMPFDYITELENAIAEERNGQMGIFIPGEAPQDNDLSPAPDCE